MFSFGRPVTSHKLIVSWSHNSILRCIRPPGRTLLTRKVLDGPKTWVIFFTASNAPSASQLASHSSYDPLYLGSPSRVRTPPISIPMRGSVPGALGLLAAVSKKSGVVGYSLHEYLLMNCFPEPPPSTSSSSDSLCEPGQVGFGSGFDSAVASCTVGGGVRAAFGKVYAVRSSSSEMLAHRGRRSGSVTAITAGCP